MQLLKYVSLNPVMLWGGAGKRLPWGRLTQQSPFPSKPITGNANHSKILLDVASGCPELGSWERHNPAKEFRGP